MQGFYRWWWGSFSRCLWCWFNDSHQCIYLLHQLFFRTYPFGPNLLLCRLVYPGMFRIVECCSMVRKKCLIFLLGIVHIFNSSSTDALTFFLSSSFVVRRLYPWNIQLSRRYLLALIDECLVQRYTFIVISPEGSSIHDLILDCVKLSYIDTLNQISDLGSWINPHMTMFLDPLNYVALILLYFHVAFKFEPLTFTRVMCGDEESLSRTRQVIYIIWP